MEKCPSVRKRIQEQTAAQQQQVQLQQAIALLEPHTLPRRRARMRAVLATRSDWLSFAFERIADPYNLSAAMRSLDSFSFQDVHLIAAEARLADSAVAAQPPPSQAAQLSRKVSVGAHLWLSLHPWPETEPALSALRARGYRICASALHAKATPLEELSLSAPLALVFGNEHSGVSAETLALADECFCISMRGFAQSLNLSVAVSITAFHLRMRLEREGGLPACARLSTTRQWQIYTLWLMRCVRRANILLKAKGICPETLVQYCETP